MTLLEPFHSTAIQLPNRVAMAPMTRGRADDKTGVPHPLTAEYYAQRACAGLIVSEGVWVTQTGKSGPGIPGLVTEQQVAAWRAVTEAVHEKGGRIFAQLWHAGRVSHPDVMGRTPVAPSAVRQAGRIFVADSWVDTVEPRELREDEIGGVVQDFATAARRAVEAGFDGVELHGANGYLLQEFLADNTNRRQDRYGGSVAARLRFPLEVVEAVAAQIGVAKVALRISPGNPENDIVEDDWKEVYSRLLAELRRYELAYLHVIDTPEAEALAYLRPLWPGVLIANLRSEEPTSQREGESLIEAGLADVVAFGRLFIANPDLPVRFALGAPLAQADHDVYYGARLDGYTDFPAFEPDSAKFACSARS
ncbi:alkene reductase [Amycolatopsis regifaucium]|uniref:1,2-oxophytodienoate reductase n=1 Tax=Amycolatopsis regifaucium TaxID=546365 RepID=A0A154MTE2_9PSEU|nr:alkene reductase [Amycolatopsis regifaucium]KZB87566.1 1,2-oxophytodienoate reductase [Amycolatopsis regifaucium]OKA08397.1 alkene reductase [Amycolatopsis regifaucium]